MRSSSPLLPLLLLSAAALPSHAQELQVLISAGDTVPGIGDVLNPDDNRIGFDLAVSNDGSWAAVIVTDAVLDEDRVVMTDEGVLVQEGVSVPGSGSTVPLTLNGVQIDESSGEVYINGELQTSGSIFGDVATFTADGGVIRQRGQAHPTAGWSPNSSYLDLGYTHIADNGMLLVRGTVRDLATARLADDFIALITLDASGDVILENVLARTGDQPQGAPAPIDTVLDNKGQAAVDGTGRVIFGVMLEGGLGALLLHDPAATPALSVLALEGQDFAPEGQPWGQLGGPGVAIAATGDLAWQDFLSGPFRQVLVHDGATIAKQGDFIDLAVGPAVQLDFGDLAPVLDEMGGLTYWTAWAASQTEGTALVRLNADGSEEVLLETGTLSGIALIGTTPREDGAFDVSPNGRFVIANVQLDGVARVVLIDRDPMENPEFCYGDGGNGAGCTDCPCDNNAPAGTIGGCLNESSQSARLYMSGVPSVAMDTLRFEMTGGNPGTFSMLTSADNRLPASMANPCFGLNTGAKSTVYNGLRCVGGELRRHGLRPMDANGDVGITNNGWGPPSGPAVGLIQFGRFVAGQTRHFQGVYREGIPAFPTTGSVLCDRGQNTTQAITVTFLP